MPPKKTRHTEKRVAPTPKSLRQLIFHGESVWRQDWKLIGKVFKSSFQILRNVPITLACALTLILFLKWMWSIYPYERFHGWELHLSSTLYAAILSCGRLCLYLFLFDLSLKQLRKTKYHFPHNALQRIGNALPFGLLAYLINSYIIPYANWGISALNQLTFNFNAPFPFVAYELRLFILLLPLLYIYCRYGFFLVAAAGGEPISLRRAATLSKPYRRPLLYTAIIWYVLLQTPSWSVHLAFNLDWHTYDPTLLFYLTRPLVMIWFAIIGSVWYEKATSSLSASDPGRSTQ